MEKQVSSFIKQTGLTNQLKDLKSYVDGIKAGDYYVSQFQINNPSNGKKLTATRIDYAPNGENVISHFKIFI